MRAAYLSFAVFTLILNAVFGIGAGAFPCDAQRGKSAGECIASRPIQTCERGAGDNETSIRRQSPAKSVKAKNFERTDSEGTRETFIRVPEIEHALVFAILPAADFSMSFDEFAYAKVPLLI